MADKEVMAYSGSDQKQKRKQQSQTCWRVHMSVRDMQASVAPATSLPQAVAGQENKVSRSVCCGRGWGCGRGWLLLQFSPVGVAPFQPAQGLLT